MRRILGFSIPVLTVLYVASCGGGGDETTGPSGSSVASVTVSPGELTVLAGSYQQLTATAKDAAGNAISGRPIAWTTSDPAIATISAGGAVTGVSDGSTTITASVEGKSGTATVSVIAEIFTSVAAGGAHTCALTISGLAFCWGRGESGQLGIPVPTLTCPTDGGPFPCTMVPVAVEGGLTFAQLAGGGAHTCGLTSDGTAYCWGSNTRGQLGDNSTTSQSDAPVAVATALKFASIDAGAQHTCALTSDGIAYCWGRNNRGQLGDGTTTNSSVPVAVTGDLTFQSIKAGGFDIGHTCGLTTSGDAYCWGDNERGQLGNGTGGVGKEDVTAHPAPAPVIGNLTFTALTAGLGRHTCGLTGTGTYCWGENSFGALGNRSTNDSAEPVPVSGGIAFAQLIAGGFIGHTCGLRSDGKAYCWGENERGQVGDNSTVDRLEPSPVSGGLTFTSIDAGFRHTCGLATAGGIYCWGSGGAGQLGGNSTSASWVPVGVLGSGGSWDY
jgi:alpha-tubulin suppressor-like RCC1 family protein